MRRSALQQLANIGFSSLGDADLARNDLRIGGGRLSDTYQIFNGRIDKTLFLSNLRLFGEGQKTPQAAA